jgi:peptide deformylase
MSKTSSSELTPNILKIVTWPNKILKRKSVEVTDFTTMPQLQADLLVTMKTNNGIGLAAPQVGINLRALAVWINPTNPLFFVNPVILSSSDTLHKVDEGCLSVPGYYEERERPINITVGFYDEHAVYKEQEFKGLSAFAIQHEIDHLDGKVFVDNLSLFKKMRLKKTIAKNIKA